VDSCLPRAMLSGNNDDGVKSCVRADLLRVNKASRVVAFGIGFGQGTRLSEWFVIGLRNSVLGANTSRSTWLTLNNSSGSDQASIRHQCYSNIAVAPFITGYWLGWRFSILSTHVLSSTHQKWICRALLRVIHVAYKRIDIFSRFITFFSYVILIKIWLY